VTQAKPVRQSLLDLLRVLARVVIDLVERQEKAGDLVWLDAVEIAALVLRDYGDRTLRELRLHGVALSSEGIELLFETGEKDQPVLWSLILTRQSPGKSEPSP